ncbi:UNVERIFIED_CONTAM: hypothetical protein PYX00_007112 [Menopon gallinae]|uniref:Senescence domain-containing protein n=1 Tax=Menopon gallinae TaxID=328185 RepID=A0AAW2HIA1_9NEOP
MNIFTCKNGQLFFIKLNGEVSSTLEGNDVTIFKFQSDLGETIFLEVGTWIYPLFSELSPCFRSQKGIFIFPDIYSECDGRFVGLILPPEESEALHFVLNELLQSQNDERTKRGLLSTDSVTTGSSYLSAVQGSKYLAGWIDSMADRYVNRLQPQQPTELNPKFVKSMEVANMVTGKAASYMGQISNGLGVAVSAMGRYISSYVPDQAKNIVPDTAVKLAANTVDCLTNVYNGLEESARILDSSLTNSAVKIVEKNFDLQSFTDDAGSSTNRYSTEYFQKWQQVYILSFVCDFP